MKKFFPDATKWPQKQSIEETLQTTLIKTLRKTRDDLLAQAFKITQLSPHNQEARDAVHALADMIAYFIETIEKLAPKQHSHPEPLSKLTETEEQTMHFLQALSLLSRETTAPSEETITLLSLTTAEKERMKTLKETLKQTQSKIAIPPALLKEHDRLVVRDYLNAKHPLSAREKEVLTLSHKESQTLTQLLLRQEPVTQDQSKYQEQLAEFLIGLLHHMTMGFRVIISINCYIKKRSDELQALYNEAETITPQTLETEKIIYDSKMVFLDALLAITENLASQTKAIEKALGSVELCEKEAYVKKHQAFFSPERLPDILKRTDISLRDFQQERHQHKESVIQGDLLLSAQKRDLSSQETTSSSFLSSFFKHDSKISAPEKLTRTDLFIDGVRYQKEIATFKNKITSEKEQCSLSEKFRLLLSLFSEEECLTQRSHNVI